MPISNDLMASLVVVLHSIVQGSGSTSKTDSSPSFALLLKHEWQRNSTTQRKKHFLQTDFILLYAAISIIIFIIFPTVVSILLFLCLFLLFSVVVLISCLACKYFRKSAYSYYFFTKCKDTVLLLVLTQKIKNLLFLF